MRRIVAKQTLLSDRRGVAATEFALIAPALILLVVGVLEMSFRFRASEEATRYVHQIADLISRETTMTTGTLETLYDASVHMMRPLDTTDKLHLDVSAVGFEGEDATPDLLWRRVAGSTIGFDVADAAGMGLQDESVIRIGVRYNYESVVSNLFGGGVFAIERSAYARPRVERLIVMDGQTDANGATVYFGE